METQKKMVSYAVAHSFEKLQNIDEEPSDEDEAASMKGQQDIQCAIMQALLRAIWTAIEGAQDNTTLQADVACMQVLVDPFSASFESLKVSREIAAKEDYVLHKALRLPAGQRILMKCSEVYAARLKNKQVISSAENLGYGLGALPAELAFAEKLTEGRAGAAMQSVRTMNTEYKKVVSRCSFVGADAEELRRVLRPIAEKLSGYSRLVQEHVALKFEAHVGAAICEHVVDVNSGEKYQKLLKELKVAEDVLNGIPARGLHFLPEEEERVDKLWTARKKVIADVREVALYLSSVNDVTAVPAAVKEFAMRSAVETDAASSRHPDLGRLQEKLMGILREQSEGFLSETLSKYTCVYQASRILTKKLPQSFYACITSSNVASWSKPEQSEEIIRQLEKFTGKRLHHLLPQSASVSLHTSGTAGQSAGSGDYTLSLPVSLAPVSPHLAQALGHLSKLKAQENITRRRRSSVCRKHCQPCWPWCR